MIPAPIHPEGWTSTAANGCTAPGCGTQDTEWLDPTVGRRCAAHWPPTEEAAQ